MQTYKSKSVDRYEFESVHEYVEFIRSHSVADKWKKSGSVVSSLKKNEKWNGDIGLDGMFDLLEFGWQEGRDKVQEMLDLQGLPEMPATIFRDMFEIDAAGFRPLVPLYCAGSPIHMLTWNQQPVVTDRVIRMRLSLALPGKVSTDTRISWGVATSMLVDALEIQGFSVELTGAFDCKHSRKQVHCYIMLKKAGQPLDLDTLISMVVHPGFERRVAFAFLERFDDYSEFSGTYGRVIDTPFPDGILIPAVQGNIGTIANAVTEIKRIFKYQVEQKRAA